MSKGLTRPAFSRRMGALLDSGFSRHFVRPYIRHNHIPMEGYERVNYRSFNDYFTRKRRAEALHIDMEPSHLISPCDSLLSAYRITPESRFEIKHCTYSLESLLRDRPLAERYAGRLCLIFRLTPSHYHRYCYIDDGRRGDSFPLDGVLHSVRPMCIGSMPVFVENQRVHHPGHCPLWPGHSDRGGRTDGGQDLQQSGSGAYPARRGKGHFAFGGSTIILLLEPGRVQLNSEIFRRTARGQGAACASGSADRHRSQRGGCALKLLKDGYVLKLVPRYAAFSLVFAFLWNSLIYNGAIALQHGRPALDMTTALEEAIPFQPGWIVVYFGCFLF